MSSATHMEYGNAAKHNADQKPSFHELLSAVKLHQLANANWVGLNQPDIGSKCKPLFSRFDAKLRDKSRLELCWDFLDQ